MALEMENYVQTGGHDLSQEACSVYISITSFSSTCHSFSSTAWTISKFNIKM